MHSTANHHRWMFGLNWSPAHAALTILLTLLFLIFLLLFLTITGQPAQAQTFTVIYSFTGGDDGWGPGSLATDRAGNVYGTSYGGITGGDCQRYSGCGTVFKLAQASGWAFSSLYRFPASEEGAWPGGLTVGPNGSLYGTTDWGGEYGCDGFGCGTVFNVRPGKTARATPLWAHSVLYGFRGGSDGDGTAGISGITFDQSGNIYGTTVDGGDYGLGCVYKLTPSSGGWTETILHSFSGADGANPYSGVILDHSGNLYGTTLYGGSSGWGTIFQLTQSESGWSESVLYSFQARDDGWFPSAGMTLDPVGNLYGATLNGGAGGGGTVFMLSPSGGGRTFTVLYSLTSSGLYGGPHASLAIDAAGNLYGTTVTAGCLGYACSVGFQPATGEHGTVFELSPASGGWTYRLLHEFTGGSDGIDPWYGVILGANGKLYGTARGGTLGYGLVFEITP